MCMGLLQNLCTSLGFTSRRRWVRASPFIWWGTPHWGVWSCVATIISVAPPHRDVDGLCLATIIAMVLTSPPPFQWAPPRRDVDGLCLATVISMSNTSDGCRRVIYFAAWQGRGGRRCPHWVQMIEPLIFGVGTEGWHIGSK